MRILFVAMQHSVHTARWIDQIAARGWDLHLFPVDHQPLHTELHDLTVHPLIRVASPPDAVRQTGLRWPTSRGLVTGRGLLEALPVPWTRRSARLAKAIKSLKPDLIHVLHMQHAGYLLTEAAQGLPALPPVIYSSWGSDFYYYGELDSHREKIRRFMSLCDYHIADCERDVGLAKEFGFTGKSLGVFPVSGGFDLPAVRAFARSGPPSARRVIALKGYHDPQWAGRALVGMHALVECRDALRDYEIEVFAATDNTRHVADFVTRALGMRVRVLPPSGNQAVLELLGRARVSIGLSITDGTPISLLEAMIMARCRYRATRSPRRSGSATARPAFSCRPRTPRPLRARSGTRSSTTHWSTARPNRTRRSSTPSCRANRSPHAYERSTRRSRPGLAVHAWLPHRPVLLRVEVDGVVGCYQPSTAPSASATRRRARARISCDGRVRIGLQGLPA